MERDSLIDHMHMTSQKGAQLRWGSNEGTATCAIAKHAARGATHACHTAGLARLGPRTERLSANAHCQHNTCTLRDTSLASLLWRCDPLWRQCIRSIVRDVAILLKSTMLWHRGLTAFHKSRALTIHYLFVILCNGPIHIFPCQVMNVPRVHTALMGSDSPILCDAGTFLNSTHNDMESDCLACIPGSYCAGSGNVIPTDECWPGYYCPAGQREATPAEYNCTLGKEMALMC